MRLLALDTSSPALAVAVLDDGFVRGELVVRSSTHDLEPVTLVDRLLALCGLQLAEIDALACAIGPGSFTGLRVGLTFMKGLAGHRPLYGISTLAALAYAAGSPDRPVAACLDARRGELYGAVYREGKAIVPEGIYSPDSFAQQLAGCPGSVLLLGEGALVYRHQLEGQGRVFAPAFMASPRPAALAQLAWERWCAGERPDAALMVPNYLRAPAVVRET